MLEPSAYAQVDVIVDGALEESPVFYDETLLNDYLHDIEEDAESHGYHTEVYVMYHEHSPSLDCECAQYVTDHYPAYEYNAPS